MVKIKNGFETAALSIPRGNIRKTSSDLTYLPKTRKYAKDKGLHIPHLLIFLFFEKGYTLHSFAVKSYNTLVIGESFVTSLFTFCFISIHFQVEKEARQNKIEYKI